MRLIKSLLLLLMCSSILNVVLSAPIDYSEQDEFEEEDDDVEPLPDESSETDDDTETIIPVDDRVDTATCPEHCTCSVGALSDLVVQCKGFQGLHMNSLLPKLQSKMEDFVTRLDIDGSRIPILIEDFLSNERNYGKSLHSLRISNSSVEKLNMRAFLSAKNLEEIELVNNDIKFLPNEVLTNIPNLRMVSLKFNKKLNFPRNGPFLRSLSIQELDVSYCGISNIHAHSLSKLPKLAYLNLANNKIQKIHPAAFSKLNYLEELDLSGNEIINLPYRLPPSMQILNLRNNPKFNVSTLIELSPETSISELDISQCNIQTLPRNIFLRLNDLTSLNISHNSIKNIYFPFFLRQLLYLDMSYNRLSGALDDNLINSCTRLETLKLAGNPGLEIPETGFLGDFDSLYLLDLSGCNMKTLPTTAIEKFTSLAHFNISNNALQSLNKDIFNPFIELNTLDLSNNQLNNLPNSIFQQNNKLKYLSLAFNPYLSPQLNDKIFENKLFLNYLNIANCDFEDLPETLPESIDTLIMNDNKFRDPTQLTELIETSLLSLRSIDITNNLWKCNFEFKSMIAHLRERQIIHEGFNDTWSEYQGYVCLTDRLTEELLQSNSLRPREVVRSHFWSLVTFSLTVMLFMVIAFSITMVCKSRVSGKLSRNYRQLSEASNINSPVSKIYKQPIPPLETSDKPATTFTTSSLYAKFPVTESEIPASYVSGNYHHGQLTPS